MLPSLLLFINPQYSAHIMFVCVHLYHTKAKNMLKKFPNGKSIGSILLHFPKQKSGKEKAFFLNMMLCLIYLKFCILYNIKIHAQCFWHYMLRIPNDCYRKSKQEYKKKT